MSMMPLDILLTLARISIVAAVAFLIGRALLTRRPDAVPGVSVTALVCGCLLLALTGAEWPALWQSTLPAPRPEAAIASPSTMPVSQSEEATQPAGVSLTAVLESVRNMARTAPARESNNFWRWVCWLAGALAVIAIGRNALLIPCRFGSPKEMLEAPQVVLTPSSSRSLRTSENT